VKYILLTAAAIAVAIVIAISGASAGDAPARAFTVADSIEMTTLGDPEYWHHNMSLGRVAHYSPDNTKVVIVLRRGNLAEGTTQYSLLLYEVGNLLREPEPQTILRMPSSSNRENFASLRWLPDNRTVVFLGEEPGEERQVFSFDTASRALRQLTNSATGVLRYSTSDDGATMLYVAENPRLPLWNRQTRQHGIVVSDQHLTDLIVGRHLPENNRGELYLQHAAADPAATQGKSGRIEIEGTVDAGFAPLLSPDGSRALVRVFVSRIPQKWRAYTDPLVTLGLDSDSITEFVILDVKTGVTRALLDAPQPSAHAGVDARWAADGASVLITPVYLPLEGNGAQERQQRASGSFAAQVSLSGSIEVLAPAPFVDFVKLESWNERTNIVTLVRESAQDIERTFFRKQGGRWRGMAAPAKWSGPPQIRLKEGMNTPPHLVVIDPRGRERILLELNPAFRGLKLARQEEIEWRATDGTRVRGGLYYPPDYVRGKRYPLVIQTHGWSPRLFAADGVFTSPFAAQALANKDIVVLQAWDFPQEGREAAEQQWLRTKITTIAMHQLEQSIYEGAIDHLDAAGLIDRARVGLIGFSYTCWSVKYALSHPHDGYRYAAASVADGYDGGYFDYIVRGNRPATAQQFETTAGGKPYGAGLESWMQNSPGFNVDRVDTPLRMTPLGNPGSLLSDWEWFVLLKRMDKPVELAMIEHGTHTLVKSWDRMVVNGGNVDWFDFWLNGRQDPAAEKADQYARWEKMKP
jgi:hypothetical protein